MFFLVLFTVFIHSLFAEVYQNNIYVTYELSGGQGLGDHLLGYLHAKWVSYRYGYRLLYKPFRYSEEFALHDLEESWSVEKEAKFSPHSLTYDTTFFANPPSDHFLYIIPFFSDLEEDRVGRPEWSYYFAIDWKDEGFRKFLKPFFAQRKKKVSKNSTPRKEGVRIALHMRRGAAWDPPYEHAICFWPKRFAPLSYYIECLRKIAQLFPNQTLYAHIFTDDKCPQQIVQDLRIHLPGLPLVVTHNEANEGMTNVVEDFFEMFQCDCLIRSLSNYTLVHSLIGDYKVIMTPKNGQWVSQGMRVKYEVTEIDETINLSE